MYDTQRTGQDRTGQEERTPEKFSTKACTSHSSNSMLAGHASNTQVLYKQCCYFNNLCNPNVYNFLP